MTFPIRKWIRPEDLNANQTLFGGRLLQWIDEEAAIYAVIVMGTPRCVTKFMSEINFISSARSGEIIEIGLETKALGTTSITLSCQVRNMITQQSIITIDTIVFVGVDEQGRPAKHGKSLVKH